ERTFRAPDLEPAAGRRLIIIIVRLGSPRDSASRRTFEHLLRDFTIVGEPPIEIRGEVVAQEREHAARIHGQHRAQGSGVPDGEADADTSMAPPACHGELSRRTNPTPRTVWMSFVGAS